MTGLTFIRRRLKLSRHRCGDETFTTIFNKLPLSMQLRAELFQIYSLVLSRFLWLGFTGRVGSLRDGFWRVIAPGGREVTFSIRQAPYRAGYRQFQQRRRRPRFEVVELALGSAYTPCLRTFRDHAHLDIPVSYDLTFDIEVAMGPISSHRPPLVLTKSWEYPGDASVAIWQLENVQQPLSESCSRLDYRHFIARGPS